ncbi:hypothetical protein AU106_gp019 [Sinorhizobium phage phiM9]|uniref:Uncharacterized protein n=1 Tax=Sinorhizobium phage phiM9 TaxID=1636182 RepID=A0A0F6R5Q5_9CAUD|nr:hypothetical protein AU106_gp019 [Sinorhizobium phage phiM9]AKE44650.1 hypothetical protein Sm_phiM9_020 [Sinorhizobium phage phiM9]
MKISVNNSLEIFGSKTSIADLAQFFAETVKTEDLGVLFEAYKVEYRHELKDAQHIKNHGLMNLFFKDGSSLCIMEE